MSFYSLDLFHPNIYFTWTPRPFSLFILVLCGWCSRTILLFSFRHLSSLSRVLLILLMTSTTLHQGWELKRGVRRVWTRAERPRCLISFTFVYHQLGQQIHYQFYTFYSPFTLSFNNCLTLSPSPLSLAPVSNLFPLEFDLHMTST